MNTIPLICHHCGKTHQLIITHEIIPKNATAIHCNFCPDCEYDMDGYYNEWYSYEPHPEPEDPNQLKLEF